MSVFGLLRDTRSAGSSLVLRVPVNLAAWIWALVQPPRRAATPWLSWPPVSRLVVGALIVLAIALATMVLIDPWVAELVQLRTRSIERIFQYITSAGRTGMLLMPLGVMVIVLAAAMTPALSRVSQAVVAALAVRFGFAFLAIALPGLFTTIAKRLIGRARPYASPDDDPFLFKPFIWDSDFASMPSGHVTSAVAAALAIGWLWPRTRGVVWICAVLIALSRVVITAHHVSDIFIGAMVGAAGALLVRQWFAARRLGFAVGADGAIRAMPGPSLRRIKRVVARLFAK